MAPSANPPIYQLPDELLLQIAAHLPDSATPRHLKSLSLVSRRLQPAAQETLHTTVKLFLSCGCHVRVNPLLKLLRTLLDRPYLASKVKHLRMRAVRKSVVKICEVQRFDLESLRGRSLAELQARGYSPSHPWHRTIENSVESGFAGLLLVLLPNLTHLDVWVKDHHRGPPSSECMSGLFGGMSAPNSITRAWSGLQHLTTSDTHLLKSGIHYDSLKSLDLKTISIGTILRLNGPRCLQGAENLQHLALTVSIQFADRLLIEKAEVQLGDLFEALDCTRLRHLNMLLINDGYHLGDDLITQLDAGYFMDQLNSVKHSLETLSITLETPEDESELEWLLDMLQHQKSLSHFKAMTRLTIPQNFLFTGLAAWTTKACCPKDLPPKLETLEILYPQENVEDWVRGFADRDPKEASTTPAVKEIILSCRDEVGTPASYFTQDVDEVWHDLAIHHKIEGYAFCQIQDSKRNLADIWFNEFRYYADMEEDEQGEEHEEVEHDWNSDTYSSGDEEMPDSTDDK